MSWSKYRRARRTGSDDNHVDSIIATASLFAEHNSTADGGAEKGVNMARRDWNGGGAGYRTTLMALHDGVDLTPVVDGLYFVKAGEYKQFDFDIFSATVRSSQLAALQELRQSGALAVDVIPTGKGVPPPNNNLIRPDVATAQNAERAKQEKKRVAVEEQQRKDRSSTARERMLKAVGGAYDKGTEEPIVVTEETETHSSEQDRLTTSLLEETGTVEEWDDNEESSIPSSIESEPDRHDVIDDLATISGVSKRLAGLICDLDTWSREDIESVPKLPKRLVPDIMAKLARWSQ